MLEWALVHGTNKYGTPRGPVDAALAAGEPVLLEIDLAGARQVRANQAPTPSSSSWLRPPGRSWSTDSSAAAPKARRNSERRLATARVEMDAASEFDHVVINDDIDRAVR